jgi:hypothetical protein
MRPSHVNSPKPLDGSTDVAELTRLLESYPGVTVEDAGNPPGRQIIGLRIRNANSLAQIQFSCFAANIAISLYAESEPLQEESAEDSLGRLCLSLIFERARDDALPMFGTFLVWNLVKRGKISADDAERLLGRWNACARP